jgi:hypothetical protein
MAAGAGKRGTPERPLFNREEAPSFIILESGAADIR